MSSEIEPRRTEEDRFGSDDADVSILLQSLMENAPTGIVFFDRRYRYMRINRAMADINGLPVDAHLGRSLREVLPNHADRVQPLLAQVFATGEPIENVEISGETPAQPDVNRSWLTGFFPVMAGDVVRYVGVMVTEITQRQRVEARLRTLAQAGAILSSSLTYDDTVQTAADLLVDELADRCMVDIVDDDIVEDDIVDDDGNGGETHESLDDDMAPRCIPLRRLATAGSRRRARPDLHEQEGDELFGDDLSHSVAAVIHRGRSLFLPILTEERISKVAESEAQRAELCAVNAVSLLIVPLRARGEVLGALTLLQEPGRPPFTEDDFHLAEAVALRTALTLDNASLFAEARRAEAELRAINEALEFRIQERTQDLERSNRELEEFAYVASHDLQEPLRKVIAFGDRLQSRYADSLDETARDYINRMQQAAVRMQRLITDLLQLSRVTTRGRPFSQVDLRAVLANVVDDVSTTLEESSGHVEIGALPVVAGDESQLHQLFQNLIVNALKFRTEDTPPLVQIYVSGREEAGPHTYYRISVADNGIGLEEQYADRIFQPFQRLHGRGEYEGTGMGLAICRRIVERHGGGIQVRSEPGAGAIFTVTLPSYEPEPASTS